MGNISRSKNNSEVKHNLQNKDNPAQPALRRERKVIYRRALLILIGFMVGSVAGYLFGIRTHSQTSNPRTSLEVLLEQVNPPEGYVLPARYGNIGPQLVNFGAINDDKFVDLYQSSGQPLTSEQIDLLSQERNSPIIITRENAAFLLNLFWALGLANENPILTEGMMMRQGLGSVVKFASTGGWTLGTLPVDEIYAGIQIVHLTDDQQRLLENVSAQVFRPCCNNPVSFPDCNHGMAMLGMLELMISQGATEDELFEAAKYVNAFWFLPQNFELAAYLEVKENVNFSQAAPQMVVDKSLSSASGFQKVHQWMLENTNPQQVPGSESNCGV